MHAFCLPTTIPSLLNVEISRVAVAVVVDDHCSLERHLLLGLALAQSSPVQSSPVQPSQAKPGLPLSHPSTSPVPPTLFSTTGAGRPHAWRCVQLCEWVAGSPGSTSRGPAALSLSFSASQPVPGTLWRVLLRHVRADARTTLPHVMLTLSIVARLYLGSCMPPSRRIAALQSVVAGLETGPGARKLPVSIKSLELRVPKRFNNKRDWCV